MVVEARITDLIPIIPIGVQWFNVLAINDLNYLNI